MEPLQLALERLDGKRPSVGFAKARLRTAAREFDVNHGISKQDLNALQQVPGLARGRKAPISNVEVVSGLYAWDEDTPGAQIGGTQGKVTPMPLRGIKE